MEKLDILTKKIDMIIKLLAIQCIEGKSFDDKIMLLTNIGFENSLIGEVLGAKATTIKTRKSQLKSKKTIK